jgi:hypothetical protein
MQCKHSKNSKQGHHPYWDWALLLYIIIFVLVVRVRLLGVPLERDEGEYAYAGRLILEGIYPYDQRIGNGDTASFLEIWGQSPGMYS